MNAGWLRLSLLFPVLIAAVPGPAAGSEAAEELRSIFQLSLSLSEGARVGL